MGISKCVWVVSWFSWSLILMGWVQGQTILLFISLTPCSPHLCHVDWQAKESCRALRRTSRVSKTAAGEQRCCEFFNLSFHGISFYFYQDGCSHSWHGLHSYCWWSLVTCILSVPVFVVEKSQLLVNFVHSPYRLQCRKQRSGELSGLAQLILWRWVSQTEVSDNYVTGQLR